MATKENVAIILSSLALAGLAGYIIWQILQKKGVTVGGTGGIPSFSINVGGGVE